MKFSSVVYVFFVLLLDSISAELNGAWRWECQKGYCQKTTLTPDNEDTALSLPACRLVCSDAGALWPKPTGDIQIGSTLVKVNINSIQPLGLHSEKPSNKLFVAAHNRFKQQIDAESTSKPRAVDGGATLEINYVLANEDVTSLALDTEEGYSLTLTQTSDGRLNATITADNFFGGRNGLETLKQLIVYDDLRDEFVVPNDISITDKPAYPYRGVLLDTARNFVTVEVIKKTLDAMAASKLNSFHWHITDTHSFPFVATSLPDLSKIGAYSPKRTYTPEIVSELVQYALARGVRIIPEFDAPAHVGEGWQNTNFVVCFNAKPWLDYCVEPPCGQFDPTKDELYDALQSLYGDMVNGFQPEIFHFGGDEVHFGCWNSSDSIVDWMQNSKGWGREEKDFVSLWDLFQSQALARLDKITDKKLPVVLWTSTLTKPEYLQYLPNDRYIIQVWTTGSDPQIANLLNNGYKLILSNYDALYLDCGFGGWIEEGNNWCSPYIGWQKVYENKIGKIAGNRADQVLGAEAALWTEQADSACVDTRLWPRASALGEVLWTDPQGSWRDAEQRFLVQRERLIDLGVNADAIEPIWCVQNEENCPTTELIVEGPPSGGGTTISVTTVFFIVSISLLVFHIVQI